MKTVKKKEEKKGWIFFGVNLRLGFWTSLKKTPSFSFSLFFLLWTPTHPTHIFWDKERDAIIVRPKVVLFGLWTSRKRRIEQSLAFNCKSLVSFFFSLSLSLCLSVRFVADEQHTLLTTKLKRGLILFHFWNLEILWQRNWKRGIFYLFLSLSLFLRLRGEEDARNIGWRGRKRGGHFNSISIS